MSRNKILEAIRLNKPGSVPLPLTGHENKYTDQYLRDTFMDKVVSVGGAIFEAKEKKDLDQIILQQSESTESICSPTIALPFPTLNARTVAYVAELEAVKLSVIEGEFGVAENGAVWLPEKNMGRRILPFITEHLMLVIPAHLIVSDMHRAYEQLSGFNEGYGVFISGPSKTADIEQSLVKGAHGPLSLTVVLYG